MRPRRVTTMVVALATLLSGACRGNGPPERSEPPRESASSPNAPVASPASSAPSAEPVDRVAGWRSDLDDLLPRMESMHPDLYHGVSEASLREDVARLMAGVPEMNDDEVMTGVLRIVARIGAEGRDGHTGAFVWGTGTYPVTSLPLRLWLFPDGVFVVDALPPYRDLVGSRVEDVAGHPIAGVLAAIEPLVPRDNDATVRLVTPRFLLIPEVLHGLGLIEDTGPVPISVVGPAGAASTVDVEPVPMYEYNSWAGEYGVHLPPTPGPLYLSNTGEPLWDRPLPSSHALYVQYNRVEFLYADTLDRLRRDVARPGVQRVVVDIRHNFGGETHAFPAVARILERAAADGRTLAVITGRNTFSAASLFAARLERNTDAVFVGEPMGGSPNLYGNPRDLRLSFSGIDVGVATRYYVGSTPDDPRLTIEPDVPAELTSADYFAGRDPALEAALQVP